MNDRNQSTRRVVITGVGVVSPIGIGADAFWESLAAGRSGIAPARMMAYSAAPQNAGGEVREYSEEAAKKLWLKSLRKSLKVMCREIQLGVSSATLALEQSALDLDNIDHERIGVDFGANLMFSPPEVLKDACFSCIPDAPSAEFEYQQWGSKGLSNMEPLWLLRYLPNMPACHICIAADARGPSNSLTLDEASGNLAVAEAAHVIQRGWAEVMIAGTTGTRLHPVKTMHSALWDELAHGEGPPETWCKPFDLNRTGQVVAEGACSLVLEEEGFARRRGANVLATVLGGGSSFAAAENGRPGTTRALANAMTAALRDAGLRPEEIGHLNAHGLGERRADIEESRAIREVFGSYASRLPVTALKSYLGNSGAGCGLLELTGSILALQHGVIPPTLNYRMPDPDCPLDVVHGEARPATNKTVMNINVTRIGQASALVIRVE